MFRQLIAQVQDLVDLHGFPPLPTVPPPYLFHLQPPQFHDDRWCFLNLENNPSEDDCYNLVMKAGKIKIPSSKRTRKELNRGKLSEISTSNGTMDEDIWKDFPEDLHESIVARVPIETFFRLRSVCKKWNSMLTSESFSLQCGQLPQSQPWFYTITGENVNTGALFDPVSRKWHHPIFPAIPTKIIISPVASAGGLLCFLDIGHRSLYVCNPLTKCFKELPSRSVKVWSRIAIGMTSNKKSSDGSFSYQIMWVNSNGEYEVYNSTKDTWTCSGTMPASVKLPLSLNFRSQPVTVDGLMYFLRSNPDGIVSYDTETRFWKQFVVPTPAHLSDHTLAAGGGRIMLVGLLTKNAASCVYIWELQKMTLLWKEVDRMPNIWCLDFYGKHIKMSCLGNKGLLLLSLHSKTMNRLVTYDIVKKEWSKVPGCLLPRGRKRQWIACGTAFHPCLTAKV